MKVWKLLPFALIISILLANVASAQYDTATNTAGTIWSALVSVGMWLIFIVLGAILIFSGIIAASHNSTIGKILFYIGTLLIIVAIFLMELRYALPLLQESGVTYEACTTINWNDLLGAFACMLSGYAPAGGTAEVTILTQITFWITGIIIPLFIISYIFYDFVQAGGIIANTTAQRVIAFGLGFLAFRGFLSSQFIIFLTYGSFGIALFVIDLIFAGGVMAVGNRFFMKWKEHEQLLTARASIPVSKKIVKDLLILTINAPIPSQYFQQDGPIKKSHFEALGLINEYNYLLHLANIGDNTTLKSVAESLEKTI